ncbi:hypothetical protein [Fusobacterium periodonticum]|jgi:hypothetical protein|nr:hypothetical protein [Fusobacterium periodonticum]VTX74075.1 Uncharacterised protein [Fusobacterium periodonticum]
MIEYMEATTKDVIKYKMKWLINTIWRFYNKYVELYDFGDLF